MFKPRPPPCQPPGRRVVYMGRECRSGPDWAAATNAAIAACRPATVRLRDSTSIHVYLAAPGQQPVVLPGEQKPAGPTQPRPRSTRPPSSSACPFRASPRRRAGLPPPEPDRAGD